MELMLKDLEDKKLEIINFERETERKPFRKIYQQKQIDKKKEYELLQKRYDKIKYEIEHETRKKLVRQMDNILREIQYLDAMSIDLTLHKKYINALIPYIKFFFETYLINPLNIDLTNRFQVLFTNYYNYQKVLVQNKWDNIYNISLKILKHYGNFSADFVTVEEWKGVLKDSIRDSWNRYFKMDKEAKLPQKKRLDLIREEQTAQTKYLNLNIQLSYLMEHFERATISVSESILTQFFSEKTVGKDMEVMPKSEQIKA